MLIEDHFLSVADFTETSYTISGYSKKESFGKLKDCISFAEITGFWPLSKSNKNDISILLGQDMSKWIGKKIEIYKAMIEVDDNLIPAVKIHVPIRTKVVGLNVGE